MYGGYTDGAEPTYDNANNRSRHRNRDPVISAPSQGLDSRRALEQPFVAGSNSRYGLQVTTSPTTSGFSDLLAKELDDIHAKHSPLSSPIAPSQSQLHRYSEAGLIAMYAGGTTPSPPPAGQNASSSNSNPAMNGGSYYTEGYRDGAYKTGQQGQQNASSGYLDGSDSTSRAGRTYTKASNTQAARQPTQYAPSASGTRERLYSSEGSARSNSQQSVPSASQSYNAQYTSQAPRPSVDGYSASSQSSSGHGYFPSPHSGIAAPRPSTSSQYSWSGSLASSHNGEQSVGRSSTSSGRHAAMQGREARPLPAPVPEEEHLYLQNQYSDSNYAQPPRRAPLPPTVPQSSQYGLQAQSEYNQNQSSGSRLRTQSEFVPSHSSAQYDGSQQAPGGSNGYGIGMANSSQRMPSSGSTANSQRVRKVSQPVSSSSAVPSSSSGWLEDAMRRKESMSSTTSTHSSRQRQRYESPVSSMDSPQAEYSRHADLPAAQSLQAIANLPSQPPIHHSHSDPLYNARTPHSTPHRQNTYAVNNPSSGSAYVNSMRAANAAHHTSSTLR